MKKFLTIISFGERFFFASCFYLSIDVSSFCCWTQSASIGNNSITAPIQGSSFLGG
jgi:hypothetical protein